MSLLSILLTPSTNDVLEMNESPSELDNISLEPINIKTIMTSMQNLTILFYILEYNPGNSFSCSISVYLHTIKVSAALMLIINSDRIQLWSPHTCEGMSVSSLSSHSIHHPVQTWLVRWNPIFFGNK